MSILSNKIPNKTIFRSAVFCLFSLIRFSTSLNGYPLVIVSSPSLFCELFASYFWRQRLLKWFNFSSLAVNLPIPSYEFWPEFLNSEPKLARFRHFVWDLNDDIWIWWSRFLWIQRNWIWLNLNTSLDVNSSYKQTFYSQTRDKMSNHLTSHVMR